MAFSRMIAKCSTLRINGCEELCQILATLLDVLNAETCLGHAPADFGNGNFSAMLVACCSINTYDTLQNSRHALLNVTLPRDIAVMVARSR